MGKETMIVSKYKDLNPIFFGHSTAENDDITPPRIHNFTMVQYIESGSGFYAIDGITYNVGAGDAFIIPKGKIGSYGPDPNDLWSIYYMGFDGNLCNDFTILPPVFKGDGDFFMELAKVEDFKGNKASFLASLLFRWHSDILSDNDSPSNNYVRSIKDYIKQNYTGDIKIEDIAKNMNLSRSYLARLFKKETGQTIQQYLIFTKLKAARRYIEEGKSIKETTYSCGFKDISNFSKLYKKMYGKTAREYRQELFKKSDK
ncbi:MAG: AraC family transcriptional regulator [Clostridia bacterium]|nr:AraC family transcriptional regulator [Clostridia bacterium]